MVAIYKHCDLHKTLMPMRSSYGFKASLISSQEGKDILHFLCHTERHFDNRHMSNDIRGLYTLEDRLKQKRK